MPDPDSTAVVEPLAAPNPADFAEARLRGHSYLALRNITCECLDGVLTLRGCAPSYYLKQVAQEAVSQAPGVTRICNEIEVVAPPRRQELPS